MVEVKCDCGTSLRLGDEWAGKQGRCPKCGNVVVFPLAPKPQPIAAAQQRETQPMPAKPARPISESTVAVQSTPSARTIDTSAPSSFHPPPTMTEPEYYSKEVFLKVSGICAGFVMASLFIWFWFGRPTPPENGVMQVNPDVETNLPDQVDTTTDPFGSGEQNGVNGDPNHTPNNGTADPSHIPEVTPKENGSDVRSKPPTENTITRPAPRTDQTGLTGVARKYDDFHCRRIQSQFGVRVPHGATMLEVNGSRLPIVQLDQLKSSSAPYLFLPRGQHVVRFRTNERHVDAKIDQDLLTTYVDMHTYFHVADSIRTDELLSRSARTFDVHGAPFLLNFLGASYVSKNQWEAAERKFRRSLHVNPLFAPAHLNLAFCLLRQNAEDDARHELLLADALNIGNVFGLAPGIAEIRRQMEIDHDYRETITLDVARYISLEEKSVEDERMVALMTALSKYAVREADRGKVFNNLAVHFAGLGKTELALSFYREAMGAFKFAGPERFELARKVLSHMSVACRKSGFDEAEEYEWK